MATATAAVSRVSSQHHCCCCYQHHVAGPSDVATAAYHRPLAAAATASRTRTTEVKVRRRQPDGCEDTASSRPISGHFNGQPTSSGRCFITKATGHQVSGHGAARCEDTTCRVGQFAGHSATSGHKLAQPGQPRPLSLHPCAAASRHRRHIGRPTSSEMMAGVNVDGTGTRDHDVTTVYNSPTTILDEAFLIESPAMTSSKWTPSTSPITGASLRYDDDDDDCRSVERPWRCKQLMVGDDGPLKMRNEVDRFQELTGSSSGYEVFTY